MTKRKSIISIGLVLMFVVMAFVMVGCGPTSTETISESFTAMYEKLDAQNEVLRKNDSALNTEEYYNLTYGTVVDGYISEGRDNYTDLKNFYNPVFSVAMSYIEENREIITRLNDDDLNDGTKDLTTELNDKIKDFTTKIDDFMGAYSEFTNFFATYSGDGLSEGQLVQLRDFKREYATFVNSSVELSLTLSSVVEATGILDNISSVGLIKNYICNKILNVYNAFYIVELGNFNWQGTTQTATKVELNNIITELQNSFSIYITIIQKPADELATLTTEQLTEIRAKTDNFMTEVDAYLKALDNLDIMTLAVNHNNDLDEYMEDNIYARADINKISQFVNSTLPEFLQYLNQSFGI